MGTQPRKMSETLKVSAQLEFNIRTDQLCLSGRVLKLERIPRELLRLLTERQDQIVTRDEIVERIWGKGAFLDTDNSINGAIRKIRQVLKDDAEQPRFIQTISGKGYRFIGDIARVGGGPSLPVAIPSPQSEPERGKVDPRFWIVAFALACGAILLAGAIARGFRTEVKPAPSTRKIMLAVLPFVDLTGKSGEDYFGDGLTEEMITQLGNLDPKNLGVIARASVMPYKNRRESMSAIGRNLGVQYVLDGSVRRDANKVRISAQLIQVNDQTNLWTQEYDRELKDIFLLQDEIAQQVAKGIQLTLKGNERTVPVHASPLSPRAYEAHDLYLRGLFFWNKRTARGLQQAIEYFQQAIQLDPSDARSYAGLANSYALMSGYNLTPAAQYMPKARAAATRAVELDETLPEAHTALAIIAQDYDWDWPTAVKEYRRAIELDANYATAHHWYAECLALQGQFDEAFVEMERARKLDPLSLIIASDYGAVLYFARHYDRAIAQFDAVLEMEPSFRRAHMLIYAHVQKGDFVTAKAEVDNWARLEQSPWLWAEQAYVYGRSGQREQAQRAVEKLERWNRESNIDPAPLFVAYIGIGEKEKALASLQKAYAIHSPALTALKVDPIYDPLRDDPRFQDLLRSIGLAH